MASSNYVRVNLPGSTPPPPPPPPRNPRNLPTSGRFRAKGKLKVTECSPGGAPPPLARGAPLPAAPPRAPSASAPPPPAAFPPPPPPPAAQAPPPPAAPAGPGKSRWREVREGAERDEIYPALRGVGGL
eukprot:993899-Prorocentrum_minimum.AAC.2